MEASWSEDTTGRRVQLPSCSYEGLPAPHWLSLCSSECWYSTISSAIGWIIFSEATINFGKCPLPCFYTSRKRKHIYNVYNTPCFPHQWLVCQFPMLIYKTVSVARAVWTAEGGANMAQAPWTKTDWLPKLAGFYVIILFRVRQPNFRTTFQRCLPLHRLTKLHIQSTFLLYYAVKIWNLFAIMRLPKNHTNPMPMENPMLFPHVWLPGRNEYCTGCWNTLSTDKPEQQG